MAARLLYLIAIRVFGRLVLPGRDQASKEAEVMVFHPEVAVIRRQVTQPKPDRAENSVHPGPMPRKTTTSPAATARCLRGRDPDRDLAPPHSVRPNRSSQPLH